jgi:hypothetical protein
MAGHQPGHFKLTRYRRMPMGTTRSRTEGGQAAAAVLREIEGLHRFFEDWFLGRCPNERASFARCADALGPGFVQIDPEGRERHRAGLLKALRAAHGCHAGAGFAIRIKRAKVRLTHHGLTLATYEEWQRLGQRGTARHSTALFAPAASAPLGVAWVHLQETWIER